MDHFWPVDALIAHVCRSICRADGHKAALLPDTQEHRTKPEFICSGKFQRFCATCARCHPLEAFDLDTRTCRAKLAGQRRAVRALCFPDTVMCARRLTWTARSMSGVAWEGYGGVLPAQHEDCSTPCPRHMSAHSGATLCLGHASQGDASLMGQPGLGVLSTQLSGPAVQKSQKTQTGGHGQRGGRCPGASGGVVCTA